MLQRCHLQIANWEKLIFMNKKWPSNLQIGCVKPIDLASTCELELNLTTELEAKFHADVVDHDDFLDLNEVFKFFPPLCRWLVINRPTHALVTFG